MRLQLKPYFLTASSVSCTGTGTARKKKCLETNPPISSLSSPASHPHPKNIVTKWYHKDRTNEKIAQSSF